MPPQIVDELMKMRSIFDASGNLWVFGYGSLIWKPGFNYKRRVIGYITDYQRRFYQGTTTHRGTEEWPGRVATLVSKEGVKTWGVAYEVSGPEDIRQALEHLAEREMITGGYRFDSVTFHPRDPTQMANEKSGFEIQVFYAEQGNDQWLGKASIEMQAYQIAKARGVCGHNIEYVKKVAVFMDQEVRKGRRKDVHLFKLEQLVEHYSRSDLLDDVVTVDVRARLPCRVSKARTDDSLREYNSREKSKSPVREVQPELYDEQRLRRTTFSTSSFDEGDVKN